MYSFCYFQTNSMKSLKVVQVTLSQCGCRLQMSVSLSHVHRNSKLSLPAPVVLYLVYCTWFLPCTFYYSKLRVRQQLVSQSAKAKLSDKLQLLPVIDTTHMAKTTMRSLPAWCPAGFSRNPEAEGRSGPGQRLGPMSHPTSFSVSNSKEEVCRRMFFFYSSSLPLLVSWEICGQRDFQRLDPHQFHS